MSNARALIWLAAAQSESRLLYRQIVVQRRLDAYNARAV